MQPRLFGQVNGELIDCGDAGVINDLEKLKKFYLEFYSDNRRKKPSYDYQNVERSFKDFEKSPAYQDLPPQEKEKFKDKPPTKVIVLTFNSLDELKECFRGMVKEGIVKKGEADRIVEIFEKKIREADQKAGKHKSPRSR